VVSGNSQNNGVSSNLCPQPHKKQKRRKLIINNNNYRFAKKSLAPSNLPNETVCARQQTKKVFAEVGRCVDGANKHAVMQPSLQCRTNPTMTRPLPPRANPSVTSAGCLFFASSLFFWYSSSIVIVAMPLPRAPVTFDTAPAAPPGITCVLFSCSTSCLSMRKTHKDTSHTVLRWKKGTYQLCARANSGLRGPGLRRTRQGLGWSPGRARKTGWWRLQQYLQSKS